MHIMYNSLCYCFGVVILVGEGEWEGSSIAQMVQRYCFVCRHECDVCCARRWQASTDQVELYILNKNHSIAENCGTVSLLRAE